MNILLTEDNPTNAKVVLMLLDHLKLKATWVKDGLEALETFERNHYDLVLMDIDLPVLGGIEATRRMFNVLSPPNRPKVIAVTASDRADVRDACFAVGMCDFLTKPLTLTALETALSEHGPKSEEPVPLPEPNGDPGWIDMLLLDTLLSIDESGECRMLIEEFVGELPDTLDRMAHALENAELLRSKAHALRGSASVFGLPRLSEKAMEVEKLAREEQQTSTEWLPALQSVASESTQAVLAYLNDRAASAFSGAGTAAPRTQHVG